MSEYNVVKDADFVYGPGKL